MTAGLGAISVRWFDLLMTVIAICGAINGIDGLAGICHGYHLAILFHDSLPLMADLSQIS